MSVNSDNSPCTNFNDALYVRSSNLTFERSATGNSRTMDNGYGQIIPTLRVPALLYSHLPDLPTPTFECTKLHARLSVATCASMWRPANEGHSERYSACRSCFIGATHAGVSNASHSPIRGALICARCEESATRLIHHHICVSCFNREREVIRGRNARGAYPVRAAKLSARSVFFMESGVARFKRLERTASSAELLIATLRDAVHTVMFGWRAPRFGLRQLRLF